MKNYQKYLAGLLVLFAVAFLFYKKVYIPKHTFETLHPHKEDMTLRVHGIGNVSAREFYPVTSGVAAKILTLHTDIAKYVKKGALLATLDPVDLPQQLEAARTAVEKAQSEVESLQKEEKSLEAQRRLASITFNRYEKLKKESYASQAEYDQAKAQLDSLTAQINATKSRIVSSRIAVKIAQKNVEALQTKLAQFRIYAPVSGLVVEKEAEVGQNVLPSQKLFTVVRPGDVWVKAYIDERLSGDIHKGQKAWITLRSKKGEKLYGSVERIEPQSDAVTQEREVEVAFKQVPKPFYINEQAEVEIETKTLHNALVVPSKLIGFEKGVQGVWILQDSKAHFQKLEILGIVGAKAAVKGIEPSATIIVPDSHKKALKEGMKVYR